MYNLCSGEPGNEASNQQVLGVYSRSQACLLFDLWIRLDRGWFVEAFLEMCVVLMRVVHSS